MRINTIADLINDANVCVDVGSDHANLSVNLIKKNKSKIVYNIEKNEGPLQNSINNTKDFKGRIFNIKSDGFKDFDVKIKIDYCVISGMGSKTIIDILTNCRNRVDCFITCANNGYEKLREWIKKNKYRIYFEQTIKDNDIFYEIICFSKIKGNRIFWPNTPLFGVRKIKKNDNLYIEKLKFELNKTNGLDFKKMNKKKYKKIIKIKRYIKKYDNK